MPPFAVSSAWTVTVGRGAGPPCRRTHARHTPRGRDRDPVTSATARGCARGRRGRRGRSGLAGPVRVLAGRGQIARRKQDSLTETTSDPPAQRVAAVWRLRGTPTASPPGRLGTPADPRGAASGRAAPRWSCPCRGGPEPASRVRYQVLGTVPKGPDVRPATGATPPSPGRIGLADVTRRPPRRLLPGGVQSRSATANSRPPIMAMFLWN